MSTTTLTAPIRANTNGAKTRPGLGRLVAVELRKTVNTRAGLWLQVATVVITALVVTAPGSALTEADVIAWTKQKLAGYKCPKRVEFRAELARTATGKLQKFKLREPFWDGHERQVN